MALYMHSPYAAMSHGGDVWGVSVVTERGRRPDRAKCQIALRCYAQVRAPNTDTLVAAQR